MPWHLFLPLLASMLFPVGLIAFKKAGQYGVGSWTITFVANICAVLVFSTWSLAGVQGTWSLIWQPGVVALLFVAGQILTFLAIDRGDVSVATPILSVKVVLVAIMLTLLMGESLRLSVWLAACGATVGVGLIQQSASGVDARRYSFAAIFAVMAASCFAMFDVLVQHWAPAWGIEAFLPTMFWIAGIMSLGFLPRVQFQVLRDRRALRLVLAGGMIIATQALLLVTSIAFFSDAARINIVYSLRGLWGVLLAWLFAGWLAAGEAHSSRRMMVSRLLNALLLTVSVIAAIVG